MQCGSLIVDSDRKSAGFGRAYFERPTVWGPSTPADIGARDGGKPMPRPACNPPRRRTGFSWPTAEHANGCRYRRARPKRSSQTSRKSSSKTACRHECIAAMRLNAHCTNICADIKHIALWRVTRPRKTTVHPVGPNNIIVQ